MNYEIHPIAAPSLETQIRARLDSLLGQLLQIGTTVLPEIIPLARSFGTAFSGVLTDISKALAPATHTTFLEPLANGMQKVVTITTGGGFQSFLHTLTELQGPAMRGIGEVLGADVGPQRLGDGVPQHERSDDCGHPSCAEPRASDTRARLLPVAITTSPCPR